MANHSPQVSGLTRSRTRRPRSLFLSYQTSIEKQFEFLCNGWTNHEDKPNPGANPLLSAGHDPIIGQNGIVQDHRVRRFLLPITAGTRELVQIQSEWVIATGGGYFFAPSISALRSSTWQDRVEGIRYQRRVDKRPKSSWLSTMGSMHCTRRRRSCRFLARYFPICTQFATEGIVVDGWQNRDRNDYFDAWACAFRHVILRGRIGYIKFRDGPQRAGLMQRTMDWTHANRTHYANVDWGA